MSNISEELQSRAVTYCDKEKHLAVASNVGIVYIYKVDWGKVKKGDASGLKFFKKCLEDLKKAEWVESMAYSPCMDMLAIGSHDNFIYILDSANYNNKKKIILKGSSSFIMGLDWSVDSKWIRSTDGAYELLFYNVEAKKREPGGASMTVGCDWADHTCQFGWSV